MLNALHWPLNIAIALTGFCSFVLQVVPFSPAEPVREEVDRLELNKETTPLFQQQGLTTCSVKENNMAEEIVGVQVEAWKPIAGFEGLYEVSNQGRVRSLDRRLPKSDGTTQPFRGRVLKPSVHKDGYHCVNLQHCGKIVGRLVHRLVWAAFSGPIPEEMEVNHKYGDKSNNKLADLELNTPKENCQHRDRTGLRKPARGSGSGRAKLTEDAVRAIVADLPYASCVELAAKHSVTPGAISCIALGKSWSHITGIQRKESRCSA